MSTRARRWTLEGRYYGERVQTGVDLSTGTSQNATWLGISAVCMIIAVVLLGCLIHDIKKRNENKKKGSV